ncbi:hypothetical protein DID74_01165 [Candidatus Marinamargulisbacteria bacterium SCGC AG-333-B06]|nr:hypothetical protein DID74_01165 [Candidatus Marinamargulisbacteria bacterium SCGC AG-333-B06]
MSIISGINNDGSRVARILAPERDKNTQQIRIRVNNTNISTNIKKILGEEPVKPQITPNSFDHVPEWINKITTFFYKTIANPVASDKPYINVHSVVIRRNGKEVVNVNWKGVDEKYSSEPGTACEKTTYKNGSPHRFNSATKSVIGLLVLKLLSEKPNIDGQDITKETAILDVLGLTDEQKKKYFKNEKQRADWNKVTIEHCLNMTAGFKWNETGSYSTANSNTSTDKTTKNDASECYLVDDLFKHIFTKEIINEPGEKFNYSGGCAMLLGEIIEKISDKSVEEYAQEALFTPLGIEAKNVVWRKTKENFTGCSGGLSMIPSDMAKIGQLLLNKGKWQNPETKEEIQIIPEQCVDMIIPINPETKKVAPKVTTNQWNYAEYGCQWWTQKIKLEDGSELLAYVAQGYGGQNLFVIPKENLVAVINTGNYSATDKPTNQTPKRLLINEILPGLGIKTETFGETY